ncbi:MAG: DUF2254 family protein [Trebonia sp.]|jgi:uncharacterized membrane protein
MTTPANTAAPARPGRRFTRRRHRLRAGLTQLLFLAAGLAGGIFAPKITVSPMVPSGKIGDMLFTAGATVISLVTVIYSLLFLVVQWVSGAFSMRLALFRNDPIVWWTFAYAIGLFVFCFTAAFAIGNDKNVSVVVPALALALVVGALGLMRILQTKAFTSMLLAPTLAAITGRGREILDGLYPTARPGNPRPGNPRPAELPPLNRTVTWPDQPTVLRQLHVEPLVAAASAAQSVVVFRQTVGVTLLPGMPVADVHGGDPGKQAVLRALVTGPERSFVQDPLLAVRLLADIALRALSAAVNDPATAVQALDSLEGLLGPLAARTGPTDQLTDDKGVIRVILHLPRWDEFARGSLDDVIAAAAASPMVLLRLRDMLIRLTPAQSAGRDVIAARRQWVDDTLARNFPLIWAETAAHAQPDQPAELG